MGAPLAVEEFVVELDQTSEKQHLGLTPAWDSIPSFKTLVRKRGEGDTVGEVSGEVGTGSDSPPSDEGSHGNTSVLDLGVTEPGEGLFRTELGKTKRIPNFSEFSCVGFAHNISLANSKSRRTGALGGSEGGSRGGGGGKGKKSRELHGGDSDRENE